MNIPILYGLVRIVLHVSDEIFSRVWAKRIGTRWIRFEVDRRLEPRYYRVMKVVCSRAERIDLLLGR